MFIIAKCVKYMVGSFVVHALICNVYETMSYEWNYMTDIYCNMFLLFYIYIYCCGFLYP